MPKADISVKWFHSNMPGAPVLRGEPGALIELLDACLISGFDARTPDSITVAGEVATVTLGGGNPFERHAVVTITGASAAGLNAEWRIATSAASSFTFACPGVADGTATGASVRREPAGWGKPFSAANKGVYQSADPLSTQLYLRVNDTDARYTRVRGYESMTDVDTGTGLFPTLAQHAETLWTWLKSTTADTTPHKWRMFADGRFFWLLLEGRLGFAPTPNLFGDVIEVLPSDAYHCLIAAHISASPANNGEGHAGTNLTSNSTTRRYFARAIEQTGGPVPHYGTALAAVNDWCGTAFSAAPNAAGDVYIGSEVFLQDSEAWTGAHRGRLPGIRSSIQTNIGADLTVLEAGGRAYMVVEQARGNNAPSGGGFAFVDITGPWR